MAKVKEFEPLSSVCVCVCVCPDEQIDVTILVFGHKVQSLESQYCFAVLCCECSGNRLRAWSGEFSLLSVPHPLCWDVGLYRLDDVGGPRWKNCSACLRCLYCLDGQIDVKLLVLVTKVQTLEWCCCVIQCGEAGSPCSAVLCWEFLGNQWARWSWLSYLWVSSNRCLSVCLSWWENQYQTADIGFRVHTLEWHAMWASLAKLRWTRFAELCCECSSN